MKNGNHMRRSAIQGFIDDHNKTLRDESPTQTQESGMASVYHKIYRNNVDSGYQICVSYMPSRRVQGYTLKLINENCALAMLRVSHSQTTKLGESGAISANACYYSWSDHRDQVPFAEMRGERVTYQLTEGKLVSGGMQINYQAAMQFFLIEHNIRVDHIPEPPFREPQ